jgi:transglutaminase-like putative cysteine protease
MHVRIGCDLNYTSPYATPMVLLVEARPESRCHQLTSRSVQLEPLAGSHSFTDLYGNLSWRGVTDKGGLSLSYDAIAEVPEYPDLVLPGLPKTPVAELPDDAVHYTLASRYCPVDMFMDDAWKLFGNIKNGWEQVQAICDWLHENILYRACTTSSSTSYDAYVKREGVCRDFAHLGIVLCRALNIPARYACGYLPEIGVVSEGRPMDFHAWFEAYLGGGWHTFDARHNQPRIGRVLVGYGRDAVDTAFSTAYGPARLNTMKVWADQVAEDFMLPDSTKAA